MHPTVEEFRRQATERYGYSGEIREFETGTKTAQAAAEALCCERGQIIKSMIMRVDDEFVLVLTSGDHRVDETALAEACGVDPSDVATASSDEVKAVTGWSIGGVPPFCYERDIAALADPTLRSYDELWGAAGTPNAMLAVPAAELVEFTDPRFVDVHA
ncbi:MAG: YbaK/EbsC family protein [Halobacteriota archaeon]|uniref:YbaK/EbsC family protein n=1 Tax=Natronomonas sp. TaxID=2184060 RepID=UPI003974C060